MAQNFRGDPFAQQRIMQMKGNTTKQLEHNIIVLEIINNWSAVKDLYKRIEKGEVDMVDQMEGTWVQFLSRMDIHSFEGPEDFEKKMLKPLV